jgi:VCBS repeat-containing protein
MSNNPDILSSVRIAQRLLPGRSEGSIYGGGVAPQGTGLRKLLDSDFNGPKLASWSGLSGGTASSRWQGMPSFASPDQAGGDLGTQNSNKGWDLTNFVSGWRHGDDAAETVQPSLRTGSMSVATDNADYAPGSTATFTATGIQSGASVTFRIADLLSAPGANGIADVYTPFTVKDGGTGDLDGMANGTVVAQWQVPADGRSTGATLQLTATSDGQTATATFSDASNKIVTENQLAGTPQSTWAIHGSIANEGDSQIEGFATQISTNAGQTVSFKIDTDSSVNGYTLAIYRLGYYGGNGARLITSMHHTGTDNQPDPIFNSATRTVDAGNWSVTDSWAIPSTAVSGVYFAKLTSDTGNFQNMIPFIVRNDGTASDLLFQTSDQTWEAYNPWGGYNLYQGPSGSNSDRAYAVSYNRPIDTNSTSNLAQPADFLFGEEYAAIYWLEQNGYDISYISGIDAATNPASLLNAKAYVDVGHDEYWTQPQFANVKAAADAGLNLAFLSGNQIYWDTELAPSFDASHTPNRTVVEYKDIWSGTQLDPNGTANGGAGLFRDPVYGPGTPENSLSGTIFTVDDTGSLDNITIPSSMSQLRFWRNTSIASGNGGTLTRLLGYEWDSDLDNGARPGGLIDMSSTTMNVDSLLLDNGLTTGAGTATHSLTLYRDTTSGALVFGAGTVMWSWGLSNQYVPYHGITSPVSTAVQQSMVNLFADMGVSPQTLQASLVLAQASTDHTAPTAAISSPTGGTSFNQGQSVTITGTASDVGGRVAGIEVSTDGGASWHPATGTTSWSYSWVASGPGTHVIEARATDDSVNLQTSPATVSVNVAGTSGGGTSLFSAGNVPAETGLNDGSPLEVGVKFTSSAAGQITGLKFYRDASDTGTDLLDLWNANGTKLASAVFSNTTASGWQTVNLTTPVTINANTTYIASYHTNGAYVATTNFFASAFTSGGLTAPSSTSSGGNGVYSYGGTSSAGIFPTSSFASSNYWADIVFAPSSGSNTPPTAVADTADATEKGGVNNSTGGSPATGNVLTNDTDPDSGDTKTVTAVSFGSTAGTLGAALNGAHGSLVLNASGAFTYTVNETDQAVQALRLSTNTLSDVFNYTMRDTAGATSSTTLTITIHGANDAPVLAAQTGNQTATVGSGFTLTLPTTTFADVDSGDTLTYAATAADGTALPGWLTFTPSTRTFSGMPASANVGTVSVKVTATDLGGLAASETFSITVGTAPPTASLFLSSDRPAVLSDSDTSPVNLGVKFTSSIAGTITGIKYYKSANDTGTHTGSLWSSTGTLLASATFTNETSSGWQTVTFSSPVSITAGATYVASFHSNGHYTDTTNYFATAHTNGPLTAPASGNGVFTYGSGNSFPTSTFNATNYWVDVVFSSSSGGTNQPPVANNDSGFNATQNVPLSISGTALLANDTDPNGDILAITGVSGGVNGTASFNAQNNTVTFTPANGFTGAASFNYAITDGRGGTASATVNVTVHTPSSTIVSLFSSNPTPSMVSVNDPNSVELGMKFQASTAGDITGLRFYKGPNNTGTHVADLWSSTGTLLATATFTNETASGWQQVNFSTPVTITAGTTYIASYHTAGNYSADPNLFANSVTNAPLTAPSSASSGGNGVYAYGTGSLFPTNTFNSTSYAVDVLFRAQLAA